MKLTAIKVEDLFGIFNHNIELNYNQGITILIGENGLGKTVILELINAFFNGNYSYFNDVKFSKILFTFSNNEIWYIKIDTKQNRQHLCVGKKNKNDFLDKEPKYHSIYIYGNSTNYRREYELRKRKEYEIRRREYELGFGRNLEDEYLYQREREREREFYYRHMILEEEKITIPKWFNDSIEEINVNLIETQRIITLDKKDSVSYSNTLLKCAQELKELISDAIKKSVYFSTSLDSSYPNRLIKKFREEEEEEKTELANSYEELNTALIELNEKRRTYSSIGLISDDTKDNDILQIKENQKDLIYLLKLYIDDSHKKLEPYTELYKKIILFMNIINKRFKHKNIEINKEEGFIFRSSVLKDQKTKDYLIIPTSKLSSGEQHELILFFKLIFKTKVADLILIDEPELSLHISWQNNFIKDLKEITSINALSFIIATHSPDIIDDNWDLKVQLKGIE